jgi:REP element-mobilizing transposase RayT
MKPLLLEPGKYYHVYNRARNGHPLFADEEACRFFLRLYEANIHPIAETFAYCLLPDHLHLLVRIRDEAAGDLFKPFAMLFNGYAKGSNRHHETTGKVFKYKLKRREVRTGEHLRDLIRYINQNPWIHGAVEHPGNYRFSSFRATVTASPTLIAKAQVQEQFGGPGNLTEGLLEAVDEKSIKRLLLEE